MAKSTSSDAIESACREVHGLKAAAALVELDEMARLSQMMERAFLAVKQNPEVLRLDEFLTDLEGKMQCGETAGASRS